MAARRALKVPLETGRRRGASHPGYGAPDKCVGGCCQGDGAGRAGKSERLQYPVARETAQGVPGSRGGGPE